MMHKTPYMKNNPKDIHLTENEEKLLRMRLEKNLGISIIPQTISAPIQSPWHTISTIFAKPIALIFFGIVLSSGGILAYQMNQIKNKIQNSTENNTLSSTSNPQITPRSDMSTRTEKDLQTKTPETALVALKTKASITTNDQIQPAGMTLSLEANSDQNAPMLMMAKMSPTTVPTESTKLVIISGEVQEKLVRCTQIANTGDEKKTETSCIKTIATPEEPITLLFTNKSTNFSVKTTTDSLYQFKIWLAEGVYTISNESNSFYTFESFSIAAPQENVTILVHKTE